MPEWVNHQTADWFTWSKNAEYTKTGGTLGQMKFQTHLPSSLQAFSSFKFNQHLMITEGPCEESHV